MSAKVLLTMFLVGLTLIIISFPAGNNGLFIIGSILAFPGLMKLLLVDIEARQHLMRERSNARYFRNKGKSR